MLEKYKWLIYDNNYQTLVKFWWYPKFSLDKALVVERKTKESIIQKDNSQKKEINQENKNNKISQDSKKIDEVKENSTTKKESFFDSMFNSIFLWKISTTKQDEKKQDEAKGWWESILKDKKLEDQFKYILNLPDDKYSDNLLTSQLRKLINENEKDYVSSLNSYKSHICPAFFEIKWSYFRLNELFWKTYYWTNYPSYIDFLWTRDILWFYWKFDLSWFIYPWDDSLIQSMLKRRVTQLKAEISEAYNKWITLDSEVEIEYKDVDTIRQKLATREERYYETSFYATIYENDLEKLSETTKKFEQKVSWFWIRIKPTIQRMDEWFNSTLPLWLDDLWIYRSMVTSSLSWSFPFISNDLIDNTWILYWVNQHTWWLVIFDRFWGKLPNSNSVILATSWAWKSFTVKLEILRYLLTWIDIIVIDPENEYKSLIQKVWWTYVNIASNSNQFINPFDLPPKIEDIEYGKWDLLRSQILNLIWLISVLIWWVSPQEEALLDKAIQSTYDLKWINFEEENLRWDAPKMEDLLNILEWMNWWDNIAVKLSKFVTWTFWNLFNNFTNVDLNNWLTVFSIRDLEEVLRTPAMFNILNYIWTKVRSKKKKRLLVVDEAWIMMQHDVSANFLFWLIKRARKYWLWVTTITQDVEDFVKSKYWKPIVSNSSLQVLLKQSASSIKSLDNVFWLSDWEKQKLVSSTVWEWLIFAWPQHVSVKILASPDEKNFITTDV